MNNATYFETDEALLKAYNRRMSLSGGYEKGYDYWVGGMVCYPHAPISQMAYATSKDVDTGFAYDIGEIVKVNGNYDVVERYAFVRGKVGICKDRFPGIVCKHAGTVMVSEDHGKSEFKADIPPDVVALIRGQMKGNCPLRDASC